MMDADAKLKLEDGLGKYLANRWMSLSEKTKTVLGHPHDSSVKDVLEALWTKDFYEKQIENHAEDVKSLYEYLQRVVDLLRAAAIDAEINNGKLLPTTKKDIDNYLDQLQDDLKKELV